MAYPAKDEGMDTLDRILGLRLEKSARLSIHDIVRANPFLRRLSPELQAAMSRHRQPLVDQLSDDTRREALAVAMAKAMFDYLAAQYQYLELGTRELRELEQMYRRFAGDCRDWLKRTEPIEALFPPLLTHQDQLCAWTRARLAEVDALAWALETDDETVCGSYDAALQLDLLGLDRNALIDPILDLGCGRQAQLVLALRARGLVAFGIDRLVENGPFTRQGSWFDAPVEAGSWGTIIAHLSFTLYFLNAHLGATRRAVRYARQYMHFLDALKPDGQFCYAPSLPFIEQLLDPDRFDVVTRRIALPPMAYAPFRAPPDWQASCITRRR